MSAPAFVADQRVENALLGGALGLGLDLLAQALARHADRDLDEVAGDLLDIAADIADLGEFGGLDLEERRLGEPRQTAGDLGLAAAGRADHQDVLRQHLLAQFGRELLAAPAVPERDRDGALRLVLADDEAVELGDDFTRAERGHTAQLCRAGAAPSVTRHCTRPREMWRSCAALHPPYETDGVMRPL